MERKYVVYEHVSKDGKRYIGITSQKVNLRWRHGNGYKGNIHFYRSIQKYGWENFEHNILVENVDEEQAKLIERELIRKYKTTDPEFGYNVTRGGDTRQPCPEDAKEKIRRKNKGKQRSEDTRRKISEAKKGKKKGPMSTEQKKKISKTLIGNKRALGHHNNEKLIAMCDLNNSIIKIFRSAVEAGKELGCSNSGINKAAKENTGSCGLDKTRYGGIYRGYKWFYLDKDNNIIDNNFGKRVSKREVTLLQCDVEGNILYEFKKIKDANSFNGFPVNGLGFALRGKTKTIYRGFLWVKKS